jgi:hypothetical protein
MFVPKEIGICFDGRGFFGPLDLKTARTKYHVPEFFGLIRDEGCRCYIVDFHSNENTSGDEFMLEKAESTHPSGLYYVSDNESFEKAGELESYVLFLDEETYCFIDHSSSATDLPDIRTGKKKWKHYWEVVKTPV